MLSGPEIQRQMRSGVIVIMPFSECQLNPNSYDLTLAAELKVFSDRYGQGWDEAVPFRGGLDVRSKPSMHSFLIPTKGLMLWPQRLYLGSTMEWTESRGFVPQLNGKSSLGRLGIKVHQTAGFGDDGFCGRWTLEIEVIHPVRIYAGMRIAQVCWVPLIGERMPYSGKYQNQQGAEPYRLGDAPETTDNPTASS